MPATRKPKALLPGATMRMISPASPPDAEKLLRGLAELRRLGFTAETSPAMPATSDYFAASAQDRSKELASALGEKSSAAIICTRGGFGSTYLVDELSGAIPRCAPKILLGYSDITSLQIYLWQKRGWTGFYGPMVAAGLDAGAGAAGGYDESSLRNAISVTRGGWTLDLDGEMLAPGEARGVILGGCMTLVEATLGTPWELRTRGAILLLEDRGMKPYQVDRVLTHLRQAEMFAGVRGIILGEFPECDAAAGSPSVRDVCKRILGELGIPIVWGARVGHTARAMLTIPLGVRAKLRSRGAGKLDILEPAVSK
ncbi:MAG: LD-carboxypeptidase [Candidatus Acidiferrales bacterium]